MEILIIGSVAVDEVITLDSPLRPGSHNGAHAMGGRLGGGASNTAMALARAGDRARVVSAVGEDGWGRRLVDELSAAGVDVGLIDRHAGETTRSLVLIDHAGERTVVNLARAPVALPDGFDTLMADALYVRSADPALTRMLAGRVGTLPVLCHVPPAVAGFRPAGVLVGSASDLDAAFLADPFGAGRRIAGNSLEWMVVTDGARGARAFGRERTIEVAAPVVPVVDSTGAGDVFAAGLLHGMARRWPMERSLATAVAWGSASVQYSGTVPPEGFPAISPR